MQMNADFLGFILIICVNLRPNPPSLFPPSRTQTKLKNQSLLRLAYARLNDLSIRSLLVNLSAMSHPDDNNPPGIVVNKIDGPISTFRTR